MLASACFTNFKYRKIRYLKVQHLQIIQQTTEMKQIEYLFNYFMNAEYPPVLLLTIFIVINTGIFTVFVHVCISIKYQFSYEIGNVML